MRKSKKNYLLDLNISDLQLLCVFYIFFLNIVKTINHIIKALNLITFWTSAPCIKRLDF